MISWLYLVLTCQDGFEAPDCEEDDQAYLGEEALNDDGEEGQYF